MTGENPVDELVQFLPNGPMTKGRPPSWNVFSALDPGVWTEVIGVTSKDRLSLPVTVRKRLPWLSGAVPDGMLAVLEADGSAELVKWNDVGERLVSEFTRQWAAAPATDRGELALFAMDRFMRMSLDGPGRIGLPANLVAHVRPAGQGGIRVVVRDGRLWLWSEAHWQAGRMKRLRHPGAVQ